MEGKKKEGKKKSRRDQFLAFTGETRLRKTPWKIAEQGKGEESNPTYLFSSAWSKEREERREKRKTRHGLPLDARKIGSGPERGVASQRPPQQGKKGLSLPRMMLREGEGEESRGPALFWNQCFG